MSTPRDHAVGLYLDGIRDGHLHAALAAHVGDRYVQHSTGVADGRDGFLAFFEPFVAAHPRREIEIVRSFSDGRYVFVHAAQLLDGETAWVTADLFDTDAQGRVVEHWDVITAGGRVSPSGHTQTDGRTEVTDVDRTDANRRTVQQFVEVVLAGGDLDRVGEFVAAAGLIQHDPDIADGIDGFVEHLSNQVARGEPVRHRRLHRTLAHGNFVATLREVDRGATPHAVVDLYRLAAGRIVEHWTAAEPVPSPEVARNGGKF